jgi:hypothetical protein
VDRKRKDSKQKHLPRARTHTLEQKKKKKKKKRQEPVRHASFSLWIREKKEEE